MPTRLSPRSLDRPGTQPGLDASLRRSRALLPTLAGIGVTVAALASALIVTNTGAQNSGAGVDAAPGIANTAPVPMACRNCGVVEAVQAVQRQTPVQIIGSTQATVGTINTPTGYRMRIRMNDGAVQTIEQSGAIAAGSRVVVEGGVVRPAPGGAGQG